MRDGSFEHTFDLEDDVRYSAEVREFDGEPLVAIFEPRRTGPASVRPGRGLALRHDRRTGSPRCADYFFCPEVVTEVAAAWGVPTVLHGYRYH